MRNRFDGDKRRAWEATVIFYTRRMTGSTGDDRFLPETDFNAREIADSIQLPEPGAIDHSAYWRTLLIRFETEWKTHRENALL